MTVTRTRGSLASLVVLLALAMFVAPARATDDRGKDDYEGGSGVVVGQTGDFLGVFHDLGIAYRDDNGNILDRRELSTVPGTTEEEPGAGVAAGGHLYIFNNADDGNFAFVDVLIGNPLKLDGRRCANGFRVFDFGAANERIEAAALVDGSVIGVGRSGDSVLLVEINPATCMPGTRFGGDGVHLLDVPGGGPDRARGLAVEGQRLVIVGQSGDDAIVVKTDLDGAPDTAFDMDGFVRYNPTAGPDNLRDVVVSSGSTIFAVGEASVNVAGGAVDSLVAKVDLSNGAVDADSGPQNLGGDQEVLEAVRLYAGDLFAAGTTEDSDSRAGTVARFNTADLSLDAGCDPDGPGGNPGTGVAFYDFNDARSAFRGLTANAALIAVGWIDNGAAAKDFFELRLGPDCVIDASFAGGTLGSRIPFFFEPPPFEVVQPAQEPSPGPGPGPGPGPQPPGVSEANFGALGFRAFLSRVRPTASGAFVSGIRLDCPRFGAAGLGDRCRFTLRLASAQVSSGSRQATGTARRAVRLARGRFVVAEGARRNARLKLSRTGRRALARTRRRSVRAKLTAVVRNNAGERRTFARSVKLKLKRPAGR